MAFSPRLPDLDPIHRLAAQEARRYCRKAGLPAQDREDVQQDLIADLLTRLPDFDPARGELAAFARVCFRHLTARMARRLRYERAGRHPLSLDDLLPGSDGLTLGETIGEAEGYSAWCGQPTDAIAVLERRLDLDRAAAAIDPADHPLCAALAQLTPHEFGAQGAMPRMRIYRRIRELRLQLLAAGIASAR